MRTLLEKYHIRYFPKIENGLPSSPEEGTAAAISQVSILENLPLPLDRNMTSWLRSWVQIHHRSIFSCWGTAVLN
jgi:hypothetical protein